eukprot:10488282-Alexandrium_andersonii.AAC.1
MSVVGFRHCSLNVGDSYLNFGGPSREARRSTDIQVRFTEMQHMSPKLNEIKLNTTTNNKHKLRA